MLEILNKNTLEEQQRNRFGFLKLEEESKSTAVVESKQTSEEHKPPF